jgi:hypothetical protein
MEQGDILVIEGREEKSRPERVLGMAAATWIPVPSWWEFGWEVHRGRKRVEARIVSACSGYHVKDDKNTLREN